MYALEKIKKQLSREINTALGEKLVKPEDLVNPPRPDYGDLCLVCFEPARALGRTAVALASDLVGEIPVRGAISGLKAAGPYLNLTLDKAKVASETLAEISGLGRRYGENDNSAGERAMVEYSNVNTHKEYHVGHLRNLAYGDAVQRILAANGCTSIPVSYINDFGIHVAKTLWALDSFYKGNKPGDDKAYFLGQVYARAAAEIEKDPLAKETVTFLMRKIESRAGKEYERWQETRQWSIDGFARIYRELGINFAHIFYESEYIDRGRELVAKLYRAGQLVKSEGAIIADLSDHNLGVLMFLRSDGTALYPVADLALALEKSRRYRIKRSIYVVDGRQSLYFKQLFQIFGMIDLKGEYVHLPFEYVKLPEGMMASRKGNVISYRDLREQVFKRALNETKERHKDWKNERLEKAAGRIVNGALKFEMVKVGAGQVITFDINQCLRFEGFTAAYLQYTGARINSILKRGDVNMPINTNVANCENANDKANKRPCKLNFDQLSEVKEHDLIMKLAYYPEIVKSAGANYDPSAIAKYLFELAQSFNDYYHAVPVLKSEEKIRAVRLRLIAGVKQVLANGLGLLGIEAMDEM